MAGREYTFPDEVTLILHDPDSGEVCEHVSYAEITSVYGREFYNAMSTGLRPELMVTLPSWADDYHGEQRLEWQGVPYRIIRAYRTEEQMAELTVMRLRPAAGDPTGLGGAYG